MFVGVLINKISYITKSPSCHKFTAIKNVTFVSFYNNKVSAFKGIMKNSRSELVKFHYSDSVKHFSLYAGS